MSTILVRPVELRQTAEQLRSRAKRLTQALEAIDNTILSLKGDKFLGHRADAVQAHYAPKRAALLKAKEIVLHFAQDLDQAATNFERADKQSGSGSKPIPAPAPAPAPKVKPAPAPAENTANIKKIQDTIHAMNVTGSDRYARKPDGRTFCNIFVMDFCKKMGIPLPEYLDWNKDGRIDDYLNANEAFQWLKGTYDKGGVKTGPQSGWKTISADQAAQLAGQGKVVVAGWENPVASQSGHMALVRPESTKGNIQIAQAGWNNFEKGTLAKGFGDRKVTFFVYDP